MRRSCKSPLIEVLMRPTDCASLTLAEWDLLLQQARSNQLLARVSIVVQDHDLWQLVPEAVHPHLHASLALSRKHRRDVLWELRQIRKALTHLDCPLVLLKGAAYVAADLPAGRGRVFSDIDVMVPNPQLAVVEQALLDANWRHIKNDPYDQSYYRRWSHQLPPLQHAFRGTVLDLHHSIVPKTARVALPAERLFSEIRALPSSRGYYVLAPEDMVLHSAVHLFNDGEFSHGLRDLFDLHSLIASFAEEEKFWDRLLARAETLDLRRPLAYALRYLVRGLEAQFSSSLQQQLTAWLPSQPKRVLMDELFDEVLSPDHVRDPGFPAICANCVLDVRGHYLRMPLHLLVPHLIRKAAKSEKRDSGTPPILPLETAREARDQLQ